MPQPAGIDYDVMAEALRSLDGIHLPPGLKGLPPERGDGSWTPAGLAAAGLNALQDLPTPFALLRRSALHHNARGDGPLLLRQQRPPRAARQDDHGAGLVEAPVRARNLGPHRCATTPGRHRPPLRGAPDPPGQRGGRSPVAGESGPSGGTARRGGVQLRRLGSGGEGLPRGHRQHGCGADRSAVPDRHRSTERADGLPQPGRGRSRGPRDRADRAPRWSAG